MSSPKKPHNSNATVWINPTRTAACDDLSDPSYVRCPTCNRQFDPDDVRQKYCGTKCYRKAEEARRAKKKG